MHIASLACAENAPQSGNYVKITIEIDFPTVISVILILTTLVLAAIR